jgi:MFS family permease
VLGLGAAMAVGTAAFGAGSWALQADLVDGEHAGRLLGIANFGTWGAAAAAGLLGPLIDAQGFGIALVLAAGTTLIGGVLGWWEASVQTEARLEPGD